MFTGFTVDRKAGGSLHAVLWAPSPASSKNRGALWLSHRDAMLLADRNGRSRGSTHVAASSAVMGMRGSKPMRAHRERVMS